jgi:Na+/melibiose symporter-like transporter
MAPDQAGSLGFQIKTAATKKLSFLTIVSFTATVWPLSIAQLSFPFVAPFYAASFGMELAFIGFVLTLGRLLDIAADVFVAWSSDRTRTRWGRRKPWVVSGLLVYAPAAMLLFVPGQSASPARLVILVMLFFSGWTMAFIPFLSQGTELSDNYTDKNRINIVQSAIGLMAILAAFISPVVLVDPRATALRTLAANALNGILPALDAYLRRPSPTGAAYYGQSMLIITVLALAPILVTLPIYILKVHEQKLAPNIRKGGITSAIRNPVFLRFALGYVFLMFAHMGRTGLLPFILVFALHLPDSYLFFMMLLFASSLLITPVWSRLLERFERIKCIVFAAGLEAVGLGMLFVIPAGNPWLTGIAFVFMGLPGQTLLMVPYLIAADCSDYALWKTGADSRAVHVSLVSLIVKLGSVYAGVSIWLVGLAGFAPTAAQQPPGIILLLKVIGLGVPVLFLGLGAFIVARFPLNRARHAAVRSRLNLRAASAALMP